MAEKKKYHILNLYQDSIDEFKELLEGEGHTIVSKEEYSDDTKANVVILEDEASLAQLKEEYSFTPKDTEYTLLTKPKDLKRFISEGGRFATNTMSFSKAFKDLSLNSKIQNNLSIHLSDYYESDIHQFTIVNHLMTGTVIDELSVYAFKNGFDLVSIRSVVDQLMYYLTYLKQAGFAGIPYECEYCIVEDQFVFRMSAMVQNYSMENIVDSFEDRNSMGQVRYLLSAVANSTQFFDMTLIESPNKVMMTAYFDKNQKSRDWGFIFNNIPYASMIGAGSESKLYRDAETRNRELGVGQDELEGKIIAGGFDYFNYGLDDDSILNDDATSANKIVDYMLDLFQETYPDSSLSEFSLEHFDKFKADYDDPNFLNALSENDQNYLVEQVQKNHIVESFKETREKIKHDPEVISQLQDVMEGEISDKLSEYVNDDILNEVLALEEGADPSQTQETILSLIHS